ncbi:MAG: hypothetical protein ACE5G8_03105 [Anaerolineae bacterium]
MSIGLDLQGIILFFIFITPGFLFSRTYLAYRPRYYKEPNTFEQMALSLMGSATIHSTMLGAATVGVLVVWLATGKSFGIGYLFGSNVPMTQYPLHIVAIFLNFSTGYLLLSLLVARRAGIFLGKRLPGTVPRWWAKIVGEDPPESLLLWHIILQEEPLKRGVLWPKISLRLRNGDHFEGRLNRLKLVGDEDNTIEMAMTDVSYRSGQDPHTAPLTPLPGRTVLLQSKDILWLSRADTP